MPARRTTFSRESACRSSSEPDPAERWRRHAQYGVEAPYTETKFLTGPPGDAFAHNAQGTLEIFGVAPKNARAGSPEDR